MAKVYGVKIKMILLLINTLVSTRTIKRMAMGNSIGHQATTIKAIIRMMKEMDMARCISLMVQFIKVIGAGVCKQGKLLWYCLVEKRKMVILIIIFSTEKIAPNQVNILLMDSLKSRNRVEASYKLDLLTLVLSIKKIEDIYKSVL